MVFQIPTFDLGAALGQGVGSGISGALQQIQQIQEADRLRQALGGLSPQQVQDPIELYSALAERPDIANLIERGQIERGKIGAKQRQLSLEEQKQLRKQQLLSQYLGETDTNNFTDERKMTPSEQRKTAEDLTDQQILAISEVDPNIARLLQNQKDSLIKNKIDIHKESAKYDEKVREDAERAVRQLEAVKDIREAIGTGKVTPFKLANIFRPISDTLSNAFKNAEQGKVEAALPLLLEGWKQVFGVRLSDADLAVLLNKLPDIGKSVEANESVLDIMEKYSKPLLVKRKVAREIKQQYGGFRPINFDDLVENETEKRMSFEKPGRFQRQQVQPGTRITEDIVSNYLDLTGNNIEQAMQMAREDGYEF